MASKARKPRVSRIEEDDWIESAFDMLANGGVAAVRVEPLADRLGVTKGAFYARYPTRDALLAAMLEYWRRVSTVDVLTAFAEINERPVERLRRILDLPFRRADVRNRARMEMAIRIWAHHDERAAKTMAEIDAYRIRYFESVLRANGFAAPEAEARAFLIYAYVVADGSLPGARSPALRSRVRQLLSTELDNENEAQQTD